MKKRYIDIKELSEYISVQENTIRWWTWQRQIPFRKFGRLIRFDLEQIDQWSRSKTVEALK